MLPKYISASQVWHAVGRDRKPLRKQYIDAIIPPFVAILRRWRPLLVGIHELASPDGLNPLAVDDRALAADALPVEVGKECLLLSKAIIISIFFMKYQNSLFFPLCSGCSCNDLSSLGSCVCITPSFNGSSYDRCWCFWC